MNEIYVVVELQKNNGQLAYIINTSTNKAQANYQFHYSAAFAAISEIEKHSVTLINGDNNPLGRAIYPHTDITTNKLYIVIEVQASEEQINYLASTYSTEQEAYHEFYRVASAAAISSVPKHLVFLLDEDGYSVDYTMFEHSSEE